MITTEAMIEQRAPYPHALKCLVDGLVYRPGWTFELEDINRGQGCAGLTLSILITCQDTYNVNCTMKVVHYMPVPTAAYDLRSWRRWLLEQLILVPSVTRRASSFRSMASGRMPRTTGPETILTLSLTTARSRICGPTTWV